MFALAALQHAARESREERGVAKFTKVKIPVAVGNRGESASLQLKLPNQRRDVAIATPAQLHKQVAHAWGVVVAPNQAGLTDAKAPAPSTELSAGEAWHHYQAAQQGVVDSARFLVAFSIVPSLHSNGAPPTAPPRCTRPPPPATPLPSRCCSRLVRIPKPSASRARRR